MKVILTRDVPNLGEAGDVKKVADGYARNYLIPQGMVFKARPGALKNFKQRQSTQARKQKRMKKDAETLARRLISQPITFKAKAGSTGRLYGSITKADIAAALEREIGEEFDKRTIILSEPIRQLGEHFVGVRLIADVEPQVKVLVQPESGEWPEGAEPTKDVPKDEGASPEGDQAGEA